MGNIVEVDVKGYQCRYMHLENEGKPKLVFLMGSLQEIESVQVFNRTFSQDYDYWVIELPGSGNTQPLHPKHDVCFLADCLDEFNKQVMAEAPFYLVACSYATGIALEFAKLAEDRLHRMALAGSMMDIPLSEWPTMLQLMRDCAFDTPNFAKGFIDLLTDKSGAIEKRHIIERAAIRKASAYREENFWHFVFNTIRLMCYNPIDLNKINVPTLVFTGEYDPYVKPEKASELAQALGQGTYVALGGCDHLFHIEKPKESLDLVLEFFAPHYHVLAA
jgi:pimeloyl-ACP methyl ester carboxylesterase